MKTLTFLALAALAAPVAATGDPARERRVRVALALAAAEADPPAVAAPKAADACGDLCRPFSDAMWETCRAAGTPIVLFVGGCHGRARDLSGMGAALATAAGYHADGRPEAAARIVVFGRVGAEPVHLTTLAPGVDATTLRAAVVAALPKMPAEKPPATASVLTNALAAPPKCRLVWNGREFVQVCQ